MTKNNLGTILTIILVIGGLLALFGFGSLPDLLDKISKDNSTPFTVELSPAYFDEGNYDFGSEKIITSIEILLKPGRNITYLELTEDNFKVSRKDKGLNKPTSSINYWTKNYNSQYLLFRKFSSMGGFYGNLKSEGVMNPCENCFTGTDYPYLFTFTIYYKENNGELKSKTFNKEILIK